MLNEIITYLQGSYKANPTAQIWWRIAIFPLIIAFTTKSDYKVKLIFTLWGWIWVVHFFLLEAYAAMITIVLATIRVAVSIKYSWNQKIMYFFMVLFLIASFFTYQNIFSILPITAWLIATYAYFKQSWIRMRASFLICSWLWLVHNIFNHSIWWIMTELLIEITLIITIIRLYFDSEKGRIKIIK